MREGLDAFNFSAEEKLLIITAMSQPRPWDYEAISAVKQRIKEFHITFGSKMCCYCYRMFEGEFSMVIDIEHILPKRHYKSLTFDIRNLSVACKRCNMKMKRDNLDFINLPMDASELEAGDKYKIIHPNIDPRDQHLIRAAVQVNAIKMVKYVPVAGSAKGTFAYGYFQLSEFEVNSFDLAQGASQPAKESIVEIREMVNNIKFPLTEEAGRAA